MINAIRVLTTLMFAMGRSGTDGCATPPVRDARRRHGG